MHRTRGSPRMCALHKRPDRAYGPVMPQASRAVKKPSKSFQDLPPIRVRREPPTIPEAVAAAQDLADDIEQQVEIAAGLIGLPPEAVREHVVAAAKVRSEAKPDRISERMPERIFTAASPSRAPRTVIVERRTRPPVVVERRGRPPIGRP